MDDQIGHIRGNTEKLGVWPRNAGAYDAIVRATMDGNLAEGIRNCQFRFQHPIIAYRARLFVRRPRSRRDAMRSRCERGPCLPSVQHAPSDALDRSGPRLNSLIDVNAKTGSNVRATNANLSTQCFCIKHLHSL